MDKKKLTFDFSGWATRNDVKCSDGRTIRKDAFKHNDGQTVPLVWNHNHQAADNILGHALLENREEGVYAYCSFNDTEQGKTAKELVKHGDICSLSIYANQLKQQGGDVLHGAIREVSLVLAGANPAAIIDQIMAHSQIGPEEAVLIHSQLDDKPEEFELDVEKEVIEHAEDKKEEKPAEDKPAEKEETVQEIIDSMNEKQKTVMYALVGAALEEGKNGTEEDKEEDKKEMKQNAFEQTTETNNELALIHGELLTALNYAKENSCSLKAVVTKTLKAQEESLQHSITNIGELFPEPQNIPGGPKVIKEDTAWVSAVMNNVKHIPFSNVKCRGFDITGDEARAKGYITGEQKEEEVISAWSREVTPQTVYKLQKLDRDDLIDITDYDTVGFIKDEMRDKLSEELARAYLTGDGRAVGTKGKINPAHLIPILGDDPLFTIAHYEEKGNKTDEEFANYFIDRIVEAMEDYKGTGTPTLFTTKRMLTRMLLIKDRNGRRIYDTKEKLITAMMVKDIQTPPYFSTVTRTKDGYDYKLMGILVDLRDYNVGANKGGAVTMFDDFDIDFNKYEYLIETRQSSGMVQPKGAITFEEKVAHVEAAPAAGNN